jgi:UDP-N-acetylmuramate dehydrogenase
MTVGDAIMSEKHCNFMMNMGNACAKDLEKLGEMVQKQVLSVTGVNLEWEIFRVGEKRVSS